MNKNTLLADTYSIGGKVFSFLMKIILQNLRENLPPF